MAKKRQGAAKGRDTRRIVAAAIAGLLAFIMLFSTVLGAINSRAAVTQDTIDGLKDKLSQIEAKKKQAQKELSNIKTQKKSILSEIAKLDEKIDIAKEEIDVQTQLIGELDQMIAIKAVELEQSQKEEDEQYQKLKKRVRFMYENGSMSYLSVLLSSDDFSDFLSRYEIVTQISKYDKGLFEDLKAIKESIAAQKLSLEADMASAVELKAALVQKEAELEAEYDARSKQMKTIEKAEGDAAKLYLEIEAEEDRLAEEIKNAVAALAKDSTYVGGTFMWPLPAANNVITSKYGMRKHPVTGVYKLHTGVDMRATKGTTIYAANSGTVITATYSSAYGNYVVIDHGGGVATLYAHMSKMNCSKGDKVSQGAVIGYVGSTGYSTGPHLHFEIIKNGNYINPLDEFPNFKVIYS